MKLTATALGLCVTTALLAGCGGSSDSPGGSGGGGGDSEYADGGTFTMAIAGDPGLIADAHAVVLPGVGAFGACMDAVRVVGLEEPTQQAAASGRPFLGICVGMQMLFDTSDEDSGARGLGIVPGAIRWITDQLPRPQMQWNQLRIAPEHGDDPMFAGLGDAPWMFRKVLLPLGARRMRRFGELVHTREIAL